jgi:hypothetical protein
MSTYIEAVEQFKIERASIITQKEKELRELERAFAKQWNRVSCGDIIEGDDGIRIKVDKVQYLLSNEVSFRSAKIPEVMYTGYRVTKGNVLYKRGERSSIYQSRVITINGNTYKRYQ